MVPHPTYSHTINADCPKSNTHADLDLIRFSTIDLFQSVSTADEHAHTSGVTHTHTIVCNPYTHMLKGLFGKALIVIIELTTPLQIAQVILGLL